MFKALGSLIRSLLSVLGSFYLPLLVVLIVLNYPFDTDPSIGAPNRGAVEAPAQQFYDAVYEAPGDGDTESEYIELERTAAKLLDIQAQVRSFVDGYDLQKRKILEVGSGTGTLQDMVDDYTGLDISTSVQRYYHKPFVRASATSIPFPDGTFDAVWTIWVLEHIPEPERALMEMRRVLKPDGLLLLSPAWVCKPWAAQGYEVRPYSDFGWGGKFTKATIPIRENAIFDWLHRLPTRATRLAHYLLLEEDTRLRFRALQPNYTEYWVADSDAAISLDSYEAYLWFRARGDECLNCGSDTDELIALPKPLILRIAKTGTRAGQQSAPLLSR